MKRVLVAGATVKRVIAPTLGGMLFLFAGAGSAYADWVYNWTCSSSQCASVMGGYSGTQGPFGSEIDCNSARQHSIVSATCVERGGSASGGSGSALSFIPRGATPQQTMEAGALLLGGYMIGQGLHQALFGNPQQAAANAAAAAERQRQLAEQNRLLQEQQAAEARAQEQAKEASARRLFAELKLSDSAGPMALTTGGSPPGLRLKLGDDALPAKVISEGYSLPLSVTP